MLNKRSWDIITTVLLALIPLILYFQEVIGLYVPAAYIVVVNLVLAALSQYAANRRVKDAVETVKRWEIFDYLTTILLLVAPLILALQSVILQHTPDIYLPVVSLILAGLSQFVTDKRVKKSEPVDEEPKISVKIDEPIPDTKADETIVDTSEPVEVEPEEEYC